MTATADDTVKAVSTNGKGSNGEPELPDSLRTFGAVLKALRDEANLTQEVFAQRVDFSHAYVAKIEQGRRYPPRDLAERAEECLGQAAANVLRAARQSLTRRTRVPTYFPHWAETEKEALVLYTYECRVIPGLMQPETYMRALADLRVPPLPDDQAETHIADRLDRQRLIADRPNTMFGFVIEEALLERRLGGRDVTADLIDHLLVMGQRRNVEIQVMPLRQEEHAGSDGLMYLAETPDHQWVGYTEGHQTSQLITDPNITSTMLLQYGTLRAQALNSIDSAHLLKELREDL